MSRDLCNLRWMADATGIGYKTLSSWANGRGKIEAERVPKVKGTKLFSWSKCRPILAAEVKDRGDSFPHRPVSEWPR